MCECESFLRLAANISGGVSLAPSLPRSQSADVVWLAGLSSLRLTITNNKNMQWLDKCSLVCLTLVLSDSCVDMAARVTFLSNHQHNYLADCKHKEELLPAASAIYVVYVQCLSVFNTSILVKISSACFEIIFLTMWHGAALQRY